MNREHADALVVVPGSVAYIHRARIDALAARSRLPTIWEWREAVVDGGLLAYGPDRASMWRHVATYVDKLLKGAKPGNLPVERPRTFELVINLKTAEALGLTLSPMFLFRADEVLR
jgi:putative ABC transport system substrate-binding protein